MSFKSQYSFLDRLLHTLAFRGIGLQKNLADIEDRFYQDVLSAIPIDRPVFVTSLPRAGTTLLLEMISELDGFVAHSYREMPFLLCPLLWNRLSRSFRISGMMQERAHQDGMQINYDSVEAFEEVLWKSFWPDHYQSDHIVPWDVMEKDSSGEFSSFFTNHLRKLLFLRTQASQKAVRYVSKNNANIARLHIISRLFPSAILLVPFRNPVDHAASMHRQHHHFLSLHARDPFIRHYMESLGHYEFGANLKPFNFNNWLYTTRLPAPDEETFWLAYWCAAFAFMLDHGPDRVQFVDFDACTHNFQEATISLAKILGLTNPEPLYRQVKRVRIPTRYQQSRFAGESDLMVYALKLHERLKDRSVVKYEC
ncbi:MAG: sulfotransferase [Magnetococcus sp. YQC-5]